MAVQVQAFNQGDWLKSEREDHRYSRDQVVLAAGQANVMNGTVLGRILESAVVTVTPKAGNSGNGVFTPDAATPILSNAQAGAYVVRCTTAAANSGTFRVFDPLGDVLGDVVVGAGFADQIKFLIADGSTDFAVGDQFTVTVNPGSGKVVALNLAATDGSQIAAGVLLYTSDATSSDTPATMIAREAVLSAYGLTWPAGMTVAQQAIALTQLLAKGIVVRPGA